MKPNPTRDDALQEQGEVGKTRSNTKTDYTDDRFSGWHLNARYRQQVKRWKRGNQRGWIDVFLVAHLAILAAIVLLIVGG